MRRIGAGSRKDGSQLMPLLFPCPSVTLPTLWERFNYPHTPGDRPSVTSGNQRRVADSWMNRAKDAISRHAISVTGPRREVKAQIPLFAKRFRHRVVMCSENSSWTINFHCFYLSSTQFPFRVPTCKFTLPDFSPDFSVPDGFNERWLGTRRLKALKR